MVCHGRETKNESFMINRLRAKGQKLTETVGLSNPLMPGAQLCEPFVQGYMIYGSYYLLFSISMLYYHQ